MRNQNGDRIDPEIDLRKDHYTPEELAAILNINGDHLREIVHNGDLKAFMIDHRIISIRREDVLDWLRRRALTA